MYNSFPLGCPRCGMQFLLPGPPLPGQTFGCQRCGQAFQPVPMMPGFAPPRPEKKVPWQLLLGVGSGIAAVLMLIVVVVSLLSTSRTAAVSDSGHRPAAVPPAVIPPVATTPTKAPDVASPNTVPAAPAPPATNSGRPDHIPPPLKSTDTADAVWTEFKAELDRSLATMQSIRDVPSRDAALPRFRETNRALEKLVVRSALLDPLSDAEYEAFRERKRAKASDPNQPAVNPPKIDKSLWNDECKALSIPFGMHVSQIVDTLDRGLGALPSAETAAEREERHVAFLCGAATRAVARIEKPTDLDAAIAELTVLTDLITLATKKKQSLPDDQGPSEKKRVCNQFASNKLSLLISLQTIMTNRYGENAAFTKANENFRAAVQQFTTAAPKPPVNAVGVPQAPAGSPNGP